MFRETTPDLSHVTVCETDGLSCVTDDNVDDELIVASVSAVDSKLKLLSWSSCEKTFDEPGLNKRKVSRLFV